VTRPTNSDASQWGTIGAHLRWAKTTDRTAATAPARRAFDQRFYDQVDPDHTLSPEARAKAAESARKAYFSQLALKSAQVRRRRAAS
jgi:hypothetical protein